MGQNQKRVLIIEPEIDIRLVFESLFKKADWDVYSFGSMDTFHRVGIIEKKIDLVVLYLDYLQAYNFPATDDSTILELTEEERKFVFLELAFRIRTGLYNYRLPHTNVDVPMVLRCFYNSDEMKQRHLAWSEKLGNNHLIKFPFDFGQFILLVEDLTAEKKF